MPTPDPTSRGSGALNRLWLITGAVAFAICGAATALAAFDVIAFGTVLGIVLGCALIICMSWLISHRQQTRDTTSAPTRRAVDPFSGRLLWASYGAGLLSLLTLSVAAAVVGTGWSWPVFALGFLGAGLILLMNHAMLHIFLARIVARFHPTPERQRAAKAQIRKRQRLYPVMFAIMLGWATLSAAAQTFWVVGITLALMVLVVVVLPLAVMPLLIRRGQRALDPHS